VAHYLVSPVGSSTRGEHGEDIPSRRYETTTIVSALRAGPPDPTEQAEVTFLRRENKRQLQQIAALERENSALREQVQKLAQTRAISRLPNGVVSPATKVGLSILRETCEGWADEGKEGPQPFLNSILAKNMGMDARAASTVIVEAEELGLIRVERHEEGHGKGKRTHLRIEPTERLFEHPSTWPREARRDPNGKACGCNARLIANVVRYEKTITETKVITKCERCNTVHKTRIFREPVDDKPPIPVGNPIAFKSEDAAIRYVETGDESGKIDTSYWTSNSQRGRSYQSRSDRYNKPQSVVAAS
jgi:hypothetical protein